MSKFNSCIVLTGHKASHDEQVCCMAILYSNYKSVLKTEETIQTINSTLMYIYMQAISQFILCFICKHYLLSLPLITMCLVRSSSVQRHMIEY